MTIFNIRLVPLSPTGTEDAWLRALRRYLAFIIPAHFLWELLQLPFYTIWNEGSSGEIAFAVLHCTGGDTLIATASLVLALLLAGSGWPTDREAYRRVGFLTISLGVAYTVFSEWLNIEVRGSWAYSDLMPAIPLLGTGLLPILQWIVVPLAAFLWACRPFSLTEQSKETRV